MRPLRFPVKRLLFCGNACRQELSRANLPIRPIRTPGWRSKILRSLFKVKTDGFVVFQLGFPTLFTDDEFRSDITIFAELKDPDVIFIIKSQEEASRELSLMALSCVGDWNC